MTYDRTVIIKVPASLDDAVKTVARRHYTSRSGYIRAALLAALEKDGVTPVPSAA
jgi:Arc/MetJ-type ribon-helix-helix transcriptional regulator